MFKQELEIFLEKKTKKQKIIVIYGPTASGKTSISIEIAKMLNTEIISTDSRQIFREMNIGTAKITQEEMNSINHHMINIINPSKEFSVGEFKGKSEKIIENLLSKNKIPILCGGTGLYIDSLVYDFDIPKVVADGKLRKRLEQEAKEFGNDFVYKQLKKIDPENYNKIHKNNLQYVIRAIEVMTISGKSKYSNPVKKILKYDTLFLTPYNGDREKLYERINKRVDSMFMEGLLTEVRNLLKQYKKTDFGLKTIGYLEIIEYLEGEINLEEAKEKIKQNSRNYAKRQLTWFRKYKK